MFLLAFALVMTTGTVLVVDDMLEEGAREAKKRHEEALKSAEQSAHEAAERVRAHHAHVAAGLDARLHRMG